MISTVSEINCTPIKGATFKQYPQQAMKENVQAPVRNDQFVPSNNQALPPRQLPPNAKFVMNGYGSYSISNNFFGIRIGTQTLPEGFEVRKNVFGQAVVLPKGSEGLLIK